MYQYISISQRIVPHARRNTQKTKQLGATEAVPSGNSSRRSSRLLAGARLRLGRTTPDWSPRVD
jgi:hypothetical protein